jgi:hypothetical protein
VKMSRVRCRKESEAHACGMDNDVGRILFQGREGMEMQSYTARARARRSVVNRNYDAGVLSILGPGVVSTHVGFARSAGVPPTLEPVLLGVQQFAINDSGAAGIDGRCLQER